MERSVASSRTTYPQGFISAGFMVSSDQVSPGGGKVSEVDVVGVGLFAGVTGGLFGSVVSEKLPKLASRATKVPLMVESVPKSLQSPDPSMEISPVGALFWSWMPSPATPARPLISNLTSHRSSPRAFVS